MRSMSLRELKKRGLAHLHHLSSNAKPIQGAALPRQLYGGCVGRREREEGDRMSLWKNAQNEALPVFCKN
jgi:hypothetical protein